MGTGHSPGCCSSDRCRLCVALLLRPVWAPQGCRSSYVCGLLMWLLLLRLGQAAAAPRLGMGCSQSCCSSDGGRLLTQLLFLGLGQAARVTAVACTRAGCGLFAAAAPQMGRAVGGCCCSAVGRLLMWLLLLKTGERATHTAAAPWTGAGHVRLLLLGLGQADCGADAPWI
uniref:Uncharacterized protein n=1 Tax=Myotis myotis TaxID=51298 RepID=A0A7J7Z558_MYOMY|nr:hypothetical protein mMyoMyo1_010563 [Myotis myotis]